MIRDSGVEHVDADDGVTDHEEESSEKHDPVSRHPGPPDCGGEPEDVDRDSNREKRINQTSLQQKYFLGKF